MPDLPRHVERPYRRPSTPPTAPCAACGRLVLARPRRRLCRHCYALPAVRALYPYTGSLSPLNGKRPLLFPPGCGRPPSCVGDLPPPTRAQPGSAAKFLTLCARARRGLALFHPQDPAFPLRAYSYNFPEVWRVLVGADPTIGECLQQMARRLSLAD